MKLIYNGCDLSGLGELAITQARELEGGEQTQRAKVRLMVRLDLFQRTYDENRARIESLRAALALPNALLQWQNEASGQSYVNQTAVLVSEDLPEEWGQYHQPLNLVFSYYEQAPGGAANNLPLSFFKEGSGSPIQFNVVNRWQHSAGTERFSSLRKHRKETHGKVHVEGQYFGDTTQPLAVRRAALAAQAAGFDEQMNSAQGRLQFGDGGSVFDGLVRVEEFDCDLDQLVNAINFSFTASYTLYPDEGAYATAEYTVAERDENNGQLMLTVAGRIQSPDEAGGRVKLAAVLAQVVLERGYLAGQLLAGEVVPNVISANADGDTYTELAFTTNYRRWKATNLKAEVSSQNAEGVPLGNVTRWLDKVDTSRFSPLRSQRERTTGGIEAAGTWSADMTLAVPDRRVQLLALQRALKTAVNAAEVTLSFGDFSQVVRPASFAAEINQAETGIDWSLSATYTLFPNEASYATAEYTAGESDNFTGEVRLTISGRVQAQDEASARAKLAAILTAQLTSRDYQTGAQQVGLETTPNVVEADADGGDLYGTGLYGGLPALETDEPAGGSAERQHGSGRFTGQCGEVD